MAAETLIQGGARVDLYDAMPSVGRKFLLAGKGGLNLTHSEPIGPFLGRYGTRQAQIMPLLEDFGPEHLRAWAQGLGVETFVGTSGRVFPTGMKAAPLLRAWLHRLREAGARIHVRHRWLGWDNGNQGDVLRFAVPDGERLVRANAVILALGGGSWSRLGSDGAWMHCSHSAACSSPPCGRRTAVLTWVLVQVAAGANFFARASPGNPSSR